MAEPAHKADLCIRCGYELAGLAAGAVCPECALPVAASLERSPWLRGADRDWLATVVAGLRDLHRAMRLLVWMLLSMILIGLLIAAVDAIWSVDLVARVPDLLLLLVFAGGLAVAGCMHLLGCWRATVPTPAEYGVSGRTRWLVRGCGLLLVLSGAMRLRGLDLMPPLARYELAAVHLAFQVNAMAFFFALASAMEQYERRTRGWSPELQKRHKNVRKNLAGVVILVLIFDYLTGKWGRGSWGEEFFALVYVCMAGTVARVRGAVATERVIADHRAGLSGG